MNPQLPLVSIIITSYNHGIYIGKAIESALNQSYPNLEVVVSDNCSTDNSDAVIRQFIADDRLKYKRNNENIGMLPNFRQAAYQLAEGEFITFLSSDDCFINKDFIVEAIGLVNKLPGISLVFGRSQLAGTNGKVYSISAETPYFLKEFWNGQEVFFSAIGNNTLSWGGTLIRKSAFMRVKALEAGYINSDIDTNYKIMLDDDVAFLNKVCYNALLHEGNASEQHRAKDKLAFMACVDDVAAYATDRLPNQAEHVSQWRQYLLLVVTHNGLKSLVRNNYKEYQQFRAALGTRYPEILRMVGKRVKLKAYLAIFELRQVLHSSKK